MAMALEAPAELSAYSNGVFQPMQSNAKRKGKHGFWQKTNHAVLLVGWDLGHIAAFAHDYAAWIAYEADCEGLMCVIAGKNPEDTLYSDDDIALRRTALLESLRDNLERAIDELSPQPGALRLEARMKFLARVVDATDVALSKHDQVLVPATTRLAKTRTAIPTCMACDRPLRNRERKNTSTISTMNSTSCKGIRKSKVHPLSTSLPSADFTNNTHYVMRGGFKMPAKSCS